MHNHRDTASRASGRCPLIGISAHVCAPLNATRRKASKKSDLVKKLEDDPSLVFTTDSDVEKAALYHG
jgi:hypothetical protein